jgi:hypothetical protein
MKRFLLLFLSAPTVLSAILPLVTATAPVLAAEKTGESADKFCVNAHARLVCVKSSQLARSNTSTSSSSNSTLIAKAQAEARDPDAFVNFKEEESDAAAAMFGCDCPACIRSLRQLRTMAQVS